MAYCAVHVRDFLSEQGCYDCLAGVRPRLRDLDKPRSNRVNDYVSFMVDYDGRVHVTAGRVHSSQRGYGTFTGLSQIERLHEWLGRVIDWKVSKGKFRGSS